MAIDANSVQAFIDKHKEHLTPEEITEIADTAKGYMSGQDYNRKMNAGKQELQTAQQLATAELQRAQAHEAALQKWEAENMFGPTATSPAPPPAGNFISKADFDAALKATEDRILGQVGPAVGGVFALAQWMPKFYADYQTSYGKQLDAEKFITFCNENKIADPHLGYKLFTTEDEKARLTKQHETDLVKAGEDAVRAFRTQHHLPETPLNRPAIPSPLMRTPRPVAPVVPVVPVVPAQPAAPTVAAMTAAAPDLADRMQQNFMQALEK